VEIIAGSLQLKEGAIISAATSGAGNAGNVFVTAEDITLEGKVIDEGQEFKSGLFVNSESGASGKSGSLTINAGHLQVSDDAIISASTAGSGQGGDISIQATDIDLFDGGSITAQSKHEPMFGEVLATGRSGKIFISVSDTFRLFNNSFVSVETELADAGDITLEVGSLLHLSDSSITTSVAGGTGNGGNITLNSVFVVLDEGSSIIANALEGQAGNIFIRILGGGALFQSPDSLIRASNEFGVEGSVVIDAPDTDIIAGFAGLPANFLDAASVLTQLCAERSGANVSSLVFRKYEVLPDSPYALRVQLPRVIPTLGTAKQSRAPRTSYAGNPLRPMLSCLGNG
jgi:large exoprotein involved in heme utilization and adhesion